MLDLSNKSIVLVTYSAITRGDSNYFVNRAFGMLIDGLGKYFKKIYYVASEASKTSNLYINNKSIYSYQITARNVDLVTVQSVGEINSLAQRIWKMINNLSVLSNVIRKADLVYIFLPGYSNLLAAFIAKIFRKSCFVYVGSDWRETGLLRLEDLLYQSFLKRIIVGFYSKCEHVLIKKVMFCLVTGKRLHNYYSRLNSSTYETIPMLQFREPLKNRDYKLQERLISSVKILFVGPVKESKGIEYLLRAIPIIEKNNLSVHVLLIGAIDEFYKSKIDSYIEAHSLISAVTFVGYISDSNKLKEYYDEADIFVTATLGEGFPRVIYEAMLSNLPVIATNIDSIKENLGNSDVATLVPPMDEKAIANAIIELSRNWELRRKRIQMALEFAVNKMAGDPVEQLIELLRKYGAI